MPDSAARFVALLSLLQTPCEWPSSELAQRLGVTNRTVRRDVERLRGLGYPVEASMGVYGGYRLAAGAAMPPLLLEDDEAVSLAIGLRLTAGQPVAGLEESAVRALTKVLQVMPPRLRHRAKMVATSTSASPTPRPGSATAWATVVSRPGRTAAPDGVCTPTPCHGSPHRSCTWAASSKCADRPSCPGTSVKSPTGSYAPSRSDVVDLNPAQRWADASSDTGGPTAADNLSIQHPSA